VEAPKDIKDSVTQAGAAAARSSILLNARKIKGEAIKAQVVDEKCVSCGACAKVCPYGAIKVDMKAKTPAKITAAACAGCGTCAAECKFKAITMQHFSDEMIKAQINAALEHDPQNKIVSFLCNWCSYAGGDLAGTSRLQYPPNNRFIRTMCSGRVSEDFILEAFEKGAPIVLVSGCHINDCHYINANVQTQKRMERLWEKFKKWGIRPERLQLEWISAAEGPRFAEIMRGLEEMRKKVTAEEIEFTREKIRNSK
jgi:heterodisulfide reductase subunit A